MGRILLPLVPTAIATFGGAKPGFNCIARNQYINCDHFLIDTPQYLTPGVNRCAGWIWPAAVESRAKAASATTVAPATTSPPPPSTTQAAFGAVPTSTSLYDGWTFGFEGGPDVVFVAGVAEIAIARPGANYWVSIQNLECADNAANAGRCERQTMTKISIVDSAPRTFVGTAKGYTITVTKNQPRDGFYTMETPQKTKGVKYAQNSGG
jgi:hypothetical protein